jgi:hypothetical protein
LVYLPDPFVVSLSNHRICSSIGLLPEDSRALKNAAPARSSFREIRQTRHLEERSDVAISGRLKPASSRPEIASLRSQ